MFGGVIHTNHSFNHSAPEIGLCILRCVLHGFWMSHLERSSDQTMKRAASANDRDYISKVLGFLFALCIFFTMQYIRKNQSTEGHDNSRFGSLFLDLPNVYQHGACHSCLFLLFICLFLSFDTFTSNQFHDINITHTRKLLYWGWERDLRQNILTGNFHLNWTFVNSCRVGLLWCLSCVFLCLSRHTSGQRLGNYFGLRV